MTRRTNRGALALAGYLTERGKKAELADSLKIDRGRISRWYQGDARPGAGHRLELQRRYGIDWRLWDLEVEEDDEEREAS